MTFIDLFAGCGGLSLGLLNAGWEGLFAIEKSPDAFDTFRHNLVDSPLEGFSWPAWLEIAPITTGELLATHANDLARMRGDVDLLAGGPPCQGYSFAGRRNHNDPRNKLYLEYLQVVNLVRPRFLLFENVRGFSTGFTVETEDGTWIKTTPHAELVAQELDELGYQVFAEALISSEVGIPQPRKRFVLLAVRHGDLVLGNIGVNNFFDLFRQTLPAFREDKGLSGREDTTTRMALSDLETRGRKLIDCLDSSVTGFIQVEYTEPSEPSPYQALMRIGMNEGAPPNSMRLAKHRPRTVEKFQYIMDNCPRGRTLSDENRARLNMKKHALTPLAADTLAATMTTLPDDFLHYSEPRILTVREMARLQSFPDWFAFQGHYTTGGKERRLKCPRYTQVGNAVPPLLAEAIGKALIDLTQEYHV